MRSLLLRQRILSTTAAASFSMRGTWAPAACSSAASSAADAPGPTAPASVPLKPVKVAAKFSSSNAASARLVAQQLSAAPLSACAAI